MPRTMRDGKWIARLGLPLAACAMLASCSYSYKIETRLESGTVTFHLADRKSMWGPDAEICEFYVFDTLARRPEPPDKWPLRAMRDDPAAMWGFSVPSPETGQGCSPFPLRYGSVPAGASQTVAPKPLEHGRTYEVWATAPGIYGDGKFRIVDPVENLG